MPPLFEMLGLPFLACVMMGVILAHCGMHVLKRGIIFIDITLAQVAAVGSIIAQLAFDAHEETVLSYMVSLGCVLVLAAAYTILRTRTIHIPIESLIGVSYAIAAAGAIFLIGLAPVEIHVENMLGGSLLWMRPSDALFMLAVFTATGLCFYLLRRPLRQVSEDYRQDVAAGAHTAWWDFIFYALVSIVITTAVRIAGVLVVFGFLIMPATASTILSRHWGVRLLMAWTVAVVGSLAGLAGAYYLDFSVGPVVTLSMGVLLAGVAAIMKLRSVWTSATSPVEGAAVACSPKEG